MRPFELDSMIHSRVMGNPAPPPGGVPNYSGTGTLNGEPAYMAVVRAMRAAGWSYSLSDDTPPDHSGAGASSDRRWLAANIPPLAPERWHAYFSDHTRSFRADHSGETPAEATCRAALMACDVAGWHGQEV